MQAHLNKDRIRNVKTDLDLANRFMEAGHAEDALASAEQALYNAWHIVRELRGLENHLTVEEIMTLGLNG